MFNLQPIIDNVSRAYEMKIQHLEIKIKAMEIKMSNSHYPIIKRSTSHVVIFFGRGLGFVMENLEDKNPSNNYKIGEFRDDWIESQFEVYSDYLKGKFISVDNPQDRAITFSLLQNHRGKRLEVPDCDFDKNFKYILVYSDLNFVTLPENVFHSDVTYIPPRKEKTEPKEKPYMDKVNAEVEEQLIEALKGNEGFLPDFNHTVQTAEKFESSESKEWPKVGGTVLYGPLDLRFKVIAIDGYLAWIKNDFGVNAIAAIKELKKPKSPEVELCEALAEKGVQDVVILANQIINGEFDCLKYISKEER